MIATIKLSVRQVLEALGDDNRFYASRFFNQPGHQLSTEQLLAHYIANAQIGMTVVGFNVAAEPVPTVEQYELEFAGAD